MRVGVIGAGTMGATHAAGWASLSSDWPAAGRAGAPVLAGILAEPPAEARPLAERYGCRVYESLDALLGDADIVDICAPTHLHASLSIAAAEAGRHVICEKPIARRAEDGSSMISACDRAGVRLRVAHVLRFFPEYAAAKRAVDEGRIGRVATIRLARGSYRPRRPAGSWFLDEAASGGILLDLMIHDLDFARWIAGEVKSIYAKSLGAVRPGSPVDFALAILSHESGALSHVQAAWAYPPPTFRTGFEISGDAGMMQHDSEAAAPIVSLLAGEGKESGDVGVPSSSLAESPYTTELRELYESIASGTEPRVSALDGLAALRIGLAAIESARTGRPVTVGTDGASGQRPS